jgi:WD40 repeat protein
LSALGTCLLSLAYQMARSNVTIRGEFLEMQEDDVQIDRDNYQLIWRKLFQGVIFQKTLYKPHYWVVDALDECKTPVNFFQLILKTEHAFPLRIFVSSRPSNELHSQLDGMKPPAQIQLILPKDTLQDIRWYVQNHTDFPSMQSDETREKLVDTLVGKSEGVFLWVKLVLKELRQAYSETTLKRILEDVPKGMDKLYLRSLNPLTKASYSKPLTKAILMWTACAVRPLSTTELKFALQLHIQEKNMYNLENQIATLCGHLVYVDSQRRVLMVHQTARSFLLNSQTESEFAFPEKEGHYHLALTCLKQLVHDDLKAPQSRRPSANLNTTSRSPFLDYAVKSWYEHVNKASSTDIELLNLIHKFLSSRQGNVLTWIEQIATAGELHHLIQTGIVLRTYLKRIANHFPIIMKEIETIDSWSTDFMRIVSKFGRNLLRSPPSIYHIIPPLCPREAAPYKQFGRSTRGISVLGLSSTSWDDCLATIAYHKSTATAVACGTAHFAIGASDKMVRLYTTATCQEYGKVAHGEAIRILEFNVSGQMLASAGRKSIRVWDVADKKLIAEYQTPRQSIAMTFTPDNKSLMTACHDNKIYTFNVASSGCFESEPWYTDVDSEPIYRAPDATAFSLEHKLLAVVYRGSHIYIWSWEDGYLGCCKKPQADQEILPFHASSLCFNPAPDANSLAAAYEGGTILIFDPLQEDDNIKASHKADTDTQTLACSPCGRTLISGDSRGTIKIFDFEAFDHQKLKLFYVIHGRGYNIRSLAFCADSRRFVDMRGQQTNIWEPTILVRNDASEEMSETASLEVQEMATPQAVEIDVITTMCIEPLAKHAFCGTEGGSVKVFSITTGKQLNTLYIHSNGVAVIQLAFSGRKAILASADSASRVLIWQLTRTSDSWKTSSLLLEQRMEDPVENLLFSPYETHLLVATTLADKLRSLSDPTSEPISLTWTTRNTGIWAHHPTNQSQLLLIIRSTLHIYAWDSLRLLTPSTGIPLHVENDLPSDFEIRAFRVGWAGHILATEYSALRQSRSRIRLLLWNGRLLVPETERLVPVMREIGEEVAGLVGTLGMIICITDILVVFLDDDGWLCSLNVGEVGTRLTSYKKHFFLPYDWLSTNDELLFECSEKGDIIFAKEDELAVIRKGLEHGEVIEFRGGPTSSNN